MLSREEVLEKFRNNAIDGRDALRLSNYFEPEHWPKLGIEAKPGADLSTFKVKPWTEESIKEDMRGDVEFGFEKALNKRGISSSLMYGVVQMWLWVLGDELHKSVDYAQYGLPLFKAVAVKYGFENPIGDDEGSEYKYSD